MTIRKKFVYLQKESLIDKSDLGNARVKISGCGGIIDTAAYATGFSNGIIQQCQCELGAAAVRRVGVSPTVPTNGKLTAVCINSR
jgi:hypothetical protein